MKLLRSLLTLTLCLAAAPLVAATTPCTPGLVAEGVCIDETHVLTYFSAAPDVSSRLAAVLSREAGYLAEIPCAAERIVDEGGILRQAGPRDGSCTAELAGTTVANPQPAAEVGDLHHRAMLVEKIRGAEIEAAASAAAEAAREAERAKPTPEIGRALATPAPTATPEPR